MSLLLVFTNGKAELDKLIAKNRVTALIEYLTILYYSNTELPDIE